MLQKALTIEEVCSKLKPVFGKKIDDLYLRYSMAESREEKAEIVSFLSALYNKNLDKLLGKSVLLEPPVQEAVLGEYPLAMVSYAGKKLFPFALREKDWPRHVCISGMSGSGKTTAAFHILGNFIKQDKPFLVFDWKKSFRPLMALDSNIMCFTIGNDSVSNLFKTNINRPPKGVNPKEWISTLCDLLAESFVVSYGVHKVLLETLDESFKEWGVYQGSELYPTWNHIKFRLEQKASKAKGREGGWLESALRIATVLTFGSIGKVVNHKGEGSFSVEDLFDKKVIFELNSLGAVEKKFFCEFILTYIYKYKKANQNTDAGKFDHAILVDEAHNVFLKDKTNFVKESVTDMIYREMREYGTSLICLDQHISKISDTVKGNSACHIAFQQQLPQDIWDISGIMQLKERKDVFSQLPVGSAIVKLSERYTSPFLVEIPQVELRNRAVSEDFIAKKMKDFAMGVSVEKGEDPEFKMQLIGKPMEKKLEIENVETIEEPTQVEESEIDECEEELEEECVEIESDPTENLNATQKVLYEFVEDRLAKGYDLKKIEKIMEDEKDEKYFNDIDIMNVINCALEKQMISGRTPVKKYVPKKPYSTLSKPAESIKEIPVKNEQNEDQERFLNYLRANPNHTESTVNLYKQVGLSPRKGNKVKNELIEQGLVEIKEERNEHGWKKIIRLKK